MHKNGLMFSRLVLFPSLHADRRNGRTTTGKVLAGFAAAAVAVVLWWMKIVKVDGVCWAVAMRFDIRLLCRLNYDGSRDRIRNLWVGMNAAKEWRKFQCIW